MLLSGFFVRKCPEEDSNLHAITAPPPEDGASTNFAIWAFCGHKDVVLCLYLQYLHPKNINFFRLPCCFALSKQAM